MKKSLITLFSVAALVALIGCSADAGDNSSAGKMPGAKKTEAMMAGAKVDAMAPAFTLTDANGEAHSLSDYKGKYVVLEWVNFDCPFVHKHYGAGNMQMLQKKYTEKGVVWLSICSSASGKQGYYEGEELTSRMAAEEWHGTAYLSDPTGEVGKMYGATNTPNMFVIDPKGKLIYAGAIDDTPSTKASDIPNSTNYIVASLDAAMAGKAVAMKATPPYGCSVKY